MKQQVFEGTGVALVTPFRAGEIDRDGLTDMVEHVLDGGVSFIVALGTTGEANTLNPDERQLVLDTIKKAANGRVPLVAGCFGGNNTRQLCASFEKFDLQGFSAVMSHAPSYNKPPQEGLYQHYMDVAEASPLPIILYNVPGRTASNIEAETIVRLAEASPKFIAVKEASGDLVQAMHIAKNKPDSLALLSGDDPLTLPMLACGAKGVISVVANAYPETFSGMVRAALQGDWHKARERHFSLLDLYPWLFVDGNPAGVKAALETMGLCSKEVRLPLSSIQKDHFRLLKAEMRKIEQSEPVRT